MTTATSSSSSSSTSASTATAVPPGAELLDLEECLPPMDPEVEALLSEHYGPERLLRIRRALATAPNHTCLRINTLRSGADELLASLRAEDGPLRAAWGDRLAAASAGDGDGDGQKEAADPVATPTEAPVPYLYPAPSPLATDTILVPSIRARRRRPRRQQEGDEEEAGDAVAIGKHCLQPDTLVVVVDRVCGEAVLRGANIFAKGVLCSSLGIMWDSPVLVLADLHRKIARGCPLADYAGTVVVIAQGRACMTRQQIFRAQSGLAVRITATAGWVAPPLNDMLRGRLYIQNLPSLVVSHVLNPKPGSSVVDLCACPGGKATHLAALVSKAAGGVVVACDRARKKVLELKRLSEAMEMEGRLHPLIMNSCHIVLPKGAGRSTELTTTTPAAVLAAAPLDKDGLKTVEGFFPETFDHVLLDPPCSALGLRPRLTLPTKLAELKKHVAYQKSFLWSAVFLLKVGGTMTYSTCTLNPEENEAVVRYALDTYPCLRLVPAEPRVGGPGLPGLGLSDEERGMVQLFDPSEKRTEAPVGLDTSGFFCCKFEKVASVFAVSGERSER